MKVREVGSFIREQRGAAKLSLRALSRLAGVSGAYLSQVERGLKRPSAEILQAIAKGLRISARSLYVKAGILEEGDRPDTASAVMGDPSITERQKRTLLAVYDSFREETAARRGRARERTARSPSVERRTERSKR